MFYSSFLHQSVSVLDNLLINIFSFCLCQHFIACLGQLLQKYFVDKSKDIFGGPFDLHTRVDFLYCLVEEVIIFGITEYLIRVIVASECLFEFLRFLLRQCQFLNLLFALVGFNVLLGCYFKVCDSVVVIYCFKY